jgi:hypothetical protein
VFVFSNSNVAKEINMQAAKLEKVEDRLDRGTDALRSLAGTEGKIPKGNADVGPAPTPAACSGTKLPDTLLGPRFTPGMDGSGRQYAEVRTGSNPTQEKDVPESLLDPKYEAQNGSGRDTGGAEDDSKAFSNLPDPDEPRG